MALRRASLWVAKEISNSWPRKVSFL